MQPQRSPIDVMLIDAQPIVLWGVQHLLAAPESGIKVIASASSVERARLTLETCMPDVVLMDLDLNGDCALCLLPVLTASEHTRIVLYTASRDEALIERAIRAGAHGLLRKDAPVEQLIKAIGKVSEGELWIEHTLLARILQGLTRPAPARVPDPESTRLATLTAREHKIITCIVHGNGAANNQLAQSLFISEHTLRNHLVSIYRKLGVANRLELYVFAVKHRLGAEAALSG
ncbi:MAG TPA: response regulator transcription factor [Telluria sp.]|jgi:DNA-binding NarL/FixJ family response regulator